MLRLYLKLPHNYTFAIKINHKACYEKSWDMIMVIDMQFIL